MYSNQIHTIGTAYIRDVSSVSDRPGLLVVNDKGTVSLLPMSGALPFSEASLSASAQGSNLKAQFTVDMLPKEVKMNVDLFENSIELTSQQFDSVFHFTGEFKTLLASNRSSVNIMRPGVEALIKGGTKKSIKMLAKLDCPSGDKQANDTVIVGMRVWIWNSDKFGSSNAEGKLSLKLFNREIKLRPDHKMHEIGFWDAEILYLNLVMKNELTVEFVTKDPTNYPINIYGVDVFGKQK